MNIRSLSIFNNIPTPYRSALFEELAIQCQESGIEFAVFYLSKTESVRKWNLELREFETALPVLWQRRDRRTTTGDFIINRGFVLRALRPTHVILFGYNYPSYLAIGVVRALFRRPTYLFCETTLSDRPPTAWKKALKTLILRSLFRYFMVPGANAAQFLQAHCVETDKIFLARNASPILPAQACVSVDGSGLRLLFVGRLASEKQMLAFVQTFVGLKSSHRLTIAGDGPEFSAISEIAKKASNIDMLGHIDPSELSALYSRHNVLVLVSNSEPWGMVVNEAVNHGLALLVSPEVGCVPELLDGNGALLSNITPEVLSSALAKINHNLAIYSARSKVIAAETTVERQASAMLECISTGPNARD